MARHLLGAAGIAALIASCTFYPYVSLDFDPVAVPLSMAAQVAGLLGPLVLLVGVPWLVHELRRRAATSQQLSVPGNGHRYADAAAAVMGLVAAATVLGALTSSAALGVAVLALALWGTRGFVRAVRRRGRNPLAGFEPAPVYLVVAPALVLGTQLTLARPVTDVARHRLIDGSAELLQDIEAYRATHGAYPRSVAGLWPDYDPPATAVPQYHYAATELGYRVYFELPFLLCMAPGTREVVMYAPDDEHFMMSHAADDLAPRGPLHAVQGWYAVRDTGRPRWKSFLFD